MSALVAACVVKAPVTNGRNIRLPKTALVGGPNDTPLALRNGMKPFVDTKSFALVVGYRLGRRTAPFLPLVGLTLDTDLWATPRGTKALVAPADILPLGLVGDPYGRRRIFARHVGGAFAGASAAGHKIALAACWPSFSDTDLRPCPTKGKVSGKEMKKILFASWP